MEIVDVLYVTFALLGIGLIIFIHEAGHFLAAKKVGVRVERFALGFDPTIRGYRLCFFSFKRGETEYVLGMIPFGGYVKMAGELLPERGKEPTEDELLAKSLGARAFVFVAGAVMNIVSAFLFFMIAFTIGVPFTKATIGTVVPGGRAWEAGLRTGDTVLEIDGQKVVDFTELRLASALGARGETLHLKVKRSEGETLEIDVQPEWNEFSGMRQIGVGPAWSPVLDADPPRASTASRAALKTGDKIVGAKILGEELPALNSQDLLRVVMEGEIVFQNQPFELQILRDSNRLWRTIVPEKDNGAEARPLVQFIPGHDFSGTVVRAIEPESRLKEVLNREDRVLSINGEPVHSLHWLPLINDYRTDRLQIDVESATGDVRRLDIDRNEFLLGILRTEVAWGNYNARIASFSEDSPLKESGLNEDDVIARVGEASVYTSEDAERLLVKGQGTRTLTILRGKERLQKIFDPQKAGDNLGVQWNTFAPIAAIIPGGPAAKAGITTGSRITRFGGTKIHSFGQFKKLLDKTEPFTTVSAEWVDPAGETKSSTVRVGVPAYKPVSLGLRFEEVTVQIGLLGSFQLGVQRTINVAKQVFLTLRSLLRRDVSAKNLSGPVGITHVFAYAVEAGWGKLFYLIAMVSVNLGLINLLPLPILDGGHLLFLAVEKIKGSPVDVKVQEWATSIAFFLIISLFLFVTFHDVRRLLLPW